MKEAMVYNMQKAPTGVAVLLATYNGEHYIAQQIDSLLCQTYADVDIYIHDDGSKDNTVSIIQDYASRHPQVHVLSYPSCGGACANFMSLLHSVDADYYYFCDQDDVWLDTKIEQSIDAMKEAEASNPGKPVLLCTDLTVVDQQLKTIAPSMWAYMNIHPELLQTFNEMAGNNLVTGCTMLINKQAAQSICMPMTHATMHDAWIHLSVIKHHGIVLTQSVPTVLYRQHSDNEVGATAYSRLNLIYRLRNLSKVANIYFSHYRMLRQLGYGPLHKYIYWRLLYKYRAWKLKSRS